MVAATLQWIWDHISPAPPASPTVMGKVPEDEETKRVREAFLSGKRAEKNVRSNLADRMQSGGH